MAFLAGLPALFGGATAAAGLTTAQMVALGTTAAAGLVGTYSQIQSGKYNSQVAQNEAQYAQLQAGEALRKGAEEESQYRVTLRRFLGTQRAKAAASGLDPNQGSALSLLLDTAKQGDEDLTMIRNNAARAAFGYNVESRNSRARGRLSKSEGYLGGFSTLLTSGSRAYGIWKNV